MQFKRANCLLRNPCPASFSLVASMHISVYLAHESVFRKPSHTHREIVICAFRFGSVRLGSVWCVLLYLSLCVCFFAGMRFIRKCITLMSKGNVKCSTKIIHNYFAYLANLAFQLIGFWTSHWIFKTA